MDEAVSRNVVVGFFDTLYWARRFRRAMDLKKQGRMTAIPQFTVPEIFIDDEDITDVRRAAYHSPTGNSLFTPADSTMPGGLVRPTSPEQPFLDTAGARPRANSIQQTPTSSPIRASPLTSPFSPLGDGDWQFASALSRPPSPLEGLDPSEPASSRSRANSAVSAADVLEVLDNSAWGESIRRSFTTRRRS